MKVLSLWAIDCGSPDRYLHIKRNETNSHIKYHTSDLKYNSHRRYAVQGHDLPLSVILLCAEETSQNPQLDDPAKDKNISLLKY